MRLTILLTSLALVLVTVPTATAGDVITVCGEYTTEDGEHYDDAIAVTTPEGVRSSDGDPTDEVDEVALDIAQEATDGDEKTTGNGYLDVTTGNFSKQVEADIDLSVDGTDRLNVEATVNLQEQGRSVGTDNLLWDSDGDGDAIEPNTEGHTDCEGFEDADA